jgi:hypothetical protein
MIKWVITPSPFRGKVGKGVYETNTDQLVKQKV